MNMKLKRNVGKLDAILRVGVGAGLIYLGFLKPDIINDQVASYLLGIFGSILFLSGVFRFCPFYNLIGFSSCSTD